MKKFLIFGLLIGSLLTTGCSTAQSATEAAAPAPATTNQRLQGQGQGRPNPDAMVQQLGLTEAQTVTFKEITERYAVESRKLRESAGGDRQAMRTKMETLRTSQDKEVNAILNTEQQKKYAELQAEMEAKRRQGGRPGGQRRPGGK